MTDEVLPLDFEVQDCRHCDARIWFGRTPTMANMPLEAKPVTAYVCEPRRPGQTQTKIQPVKVFLPHWGNCSGADDARKEKR